MKVITFLNEKGGVGKTTGAVHTAAGIARRGYRVLLIDTDAQANATEMLGLKPQRDKATGEKVSPGIYRLLVKEADWKYVVRMPQKAVWGGEDTQGSLMVLDSGIETRNIGNNIDDVKILAERLQELGGYVDAVVIDTAPTPSLFHSLIYVATDFMVYPSQCELPSMTGLAKSTQHMKRLQAARVAFGMPETEIVGVLPTMYQANTLAHQRGLDLIQQQFGDLTMEPIKHRTIWRDATYAGKLVYAYEPDGDAVSETDAMVDRILEGIL